MRPRTDLQGKRFGKWAVLENAGTKKGRAMWRCRCDCGKEHAVYAANLVGGHSLSCGCVAARFLRNYSPKERDSNGDD